MQICYMILDGRREKKGRQNSMTRTIQPEVISRLKYRVSSLQILYIHIIINFSKISKTNKKNPPFLFERHRQFDLGRLSRPWPMSVEIRVVTTNTLLLVGDRQKFGQLEHNCTSGYWRSGSGMVEKFHANEMLQNHFWQRISIFQHLF